MAAAPAEVDPAIKALWQRFCSWYQDTYPGRAARIEDPITRRMWVAYVAGAMSPVAAAVGKTAGGLEGNEGRVES